MRAQIGDVIVLAGQRVDEPTRDGLVLEVRGPDGGPPLLVRWNDGHTGLLYPGPGSVLRVIRPGDAATRIPAPRTQRGRATGADREREWTIRVSILEGDQTTATAVLLTNASTRLRTTGTSHRSARDAAMPQIGDDVAVARALHHLADQLLNTATHTIEDSTHEHEVHIAPR
jgi:Rv2632c-like/Domain of unknown function (DUF1918)